MRLLDVTNYLTRRGNSGATLDDFRNEFGDDNLEDIKRLLQAALDLQEIKKDGKGRGMRYYLINIEIVKFEKSKVQKKSDQKFVDGIIDISDCKTTKEKIDRILESDHLLSGMQVFSYRRKTDDSIHGKELYDYLNHGAIDIDVRLANIKNKNAIVSTREKYLNNKIIIGRDNDGAWMITKVDYECPERPTTIKFENYGEFEKCLRTLHLK